MNPAVAVVAVLLAGLARAAAAQVDARAELSRDTVALNESVEYRVTISGGGVREVDEPRVTLPIGLTLFGRSRSSEVSIIGGSPSRATTFTFTYRPFQTGRTAIGPATVRVGSDLLRVPALPLVIVAAGERGGGPGAAVSGVPFPPQAGPPAAPGAAPADSTTAADLADVPPGADLPPVFVTNRLDRAEAYVGEQVLLTFSFYQSPRAMVLDQPNYASAKTPGFWSQDLNREPDIARELVGGEPYTIQRFHYALFPLTAGEKTIAPATLTLTLRNPVSFLDRGHTRTLSGDSLRLLVKPLPTEARPANFTGAVGRFELGARVEPERGEVDAPATLTVTVTGEGNLATLPPPRITPPAGLRVFDPEVKIRTVTRGTTLHGEKEFRYLVVPHRTGRVELGRVALPYFDPDAGEYRTAVANMGALTVRPPVERDGVPGAGRGELAGLRGGSVRTRALPAPSSPPFVALAALPFLILAAVLLRHARRSRVPRTRQPAAPPFPDASRLKAGDPDGGAPALERELVGWLEWRHGVRLAGHSLEGRERVLRSAGVGDETVAEVGATLRALEDVASTPPQFRSAAAERAAQALERLRAVERKGRRRRGLVRRS